MRAYDLASRLGKQPSYVTRLETGVTKTLPPPEELDAIARELHLSVSEMLEAAGYRIVETGERPSHNEIIELMEHARIVDWQADPSRLPVMHAILSTWAEFDRNSLRMVAEDGPDYDE